MTKIFRGQHALRIAHGITVLIILLLAYSGGAAINAQAAKASPDFVLTANYGPPSFIGHLVRGGLTSCPLCTTAVEPRYVVNDPFGCFYDSNSISVVSLNDFAGTITLEMLNLPPGVTSQTATTLILPRRSAVSTPFRLQAASNAALGNATITVRATGTDTKTGTLITHTLNLPISVADALPPCA